MYSLIDGVCTATSACSVSQHSLGTTVLNCRFASNLYGVFCVCNMFKIVVSPVPCEVRSAVLFPSTVIQNRKLDMLAEITLLLHDNARSQTATQTWGLLNSFDWEVLDTSPLPSYSPDLVPNDFYHFCYLKHNFCLRWQP